MTYSAPRQGLFAVFILISLSLNLLFFVISQERVQNDNQRNFAEKETALLSEELTAPMAIGDRVSMSVVANRYLEADDLAFVGIYDSEGSLIVPVGKENTNGFTSKQAVVSGDNALGSVVVHTTGVKRATILSQNWIYLLALLGIHGILWLLYGYLAKPTKEMLVTIEKDTRSRLLNNGLLQSERLAKPVSEEPELSTDLTEHGDKPEEELPNVDQPAKQPTDGVVVQIRFNDPNSLLETVSQQNKISYLNLYAEFTQNAVKALLELPILAGVVASCVGDYNTKGSFVEFKATNAHAKVHLAAVLFSRLMIMLSQIIYNKHRELGRFALPIRTMVSDAARQHEIIVIAKRHHETPLVLLPASALMGLELQVDLNKLSDPISVAERECRHLHQVNLSNMKRLESVRDNVLLMP